MAERGKRVQPGGAGRFGSRWVVFLIWCLTLLLGGSFGLLSQGLYRVYRAECTGGRGFLSAAPYVPQQEGLPGPEKKASIIIDDLGVDLAVAREFLELDMPLTLAVLPYQRYSERIGLEAVRHGKEVILHLPLQPKGYPHTNPGTGALLLSMDRERIQEELARQLDTLPGCVGVSNHMGSLFTEQEHQMRWVLSVLSERDLFFVDSLTTPDSSARRVAADLGIPFAQRTHFLDVERTETAVVTQLCRVMDAAVRQGGAIGIAHPSEATLAALPKVAASFAEKGVRLVPISEMVSIHHPSGVGGVHAGGAPRGQTPDPS